MEDNRNGDAEVAAEAAAISALVGSGYDPTIVNMVARVRVGARRAAHSRLECAAAVDSLASGLVELCTSPYDWEPRRGSTARADVKAADLHIGNRSEPFAPLLRYEAALDIRVAADHMQGFSTLVTAERSVLGSASIARGIFEASTWAAALLDPAVPQRERLRRLIMRRIVRLLAGIREEHLLQGGDPAAAATASEVVEQLEDEHGSHLDPEQEVDDLVALAANLGWRIKRRRRSIELDEALSVACRVQWRL